MNTIFQKVLLGLLLLQASTLASQEIPYTISVVAPFKAYKLPVKDTEELEIKSPSYSNIESYITSYIDSHPGFDRVLSHEIIGKIVSEPTYTSHLSHARSYKGRGIGLYKNFELERSIDELFKAREEYLLANQDLVLVDEVSEVYLYMALSYLESVPIRETDAYLIFLQLARLNPYYSIAEGYYSPKTVEVMNHARRNLLQDSRTLLVRDDMHRLSNFTSSELILSGYYVQTLSGFELHLVVFDGALREISFHEKILLAGVDNIDRDRTDRLLSRFVACLTVKAPPEIPRGEREKGHIYLSTTFNQNMFIKTPTRNRFINRGAVLSGTYMLFEDFGLVMRFGALSSSPDVDGDLLNDFVTLRFGLGTSLVLRYDWFRLFVETGLEFGHISDHMVTTNVNCKAFGSDDPDCPTGSIQRQIDGWNFGIHTSIGFGLQIVGPVFITISGNSTFYFLQQDDDLNFPMGFRVGFDYRF